MADAFTKFLNLTKPEIAGSRDTWGQKLVADLDAIDTWAAATDALAKAALSTTVQGTQNLASSLAVAGNFSVAGGTVGLSKGTRILFGEGQLNEALNADGSVYALDNVAPKSNVWRVVNNAYNYEFLRVDVNGLRINGNLAWHAGNLTPGNYADKTSQAGQVFSGPLVVNMTTPYIDLVYGNVIRSRQIIDSNGTWIVRNGDNGDNFFYVTKDGLVWTKQFGDLNTRIEQRAAAYANSVLNTARGEYGQPFQTSGGVIGGDVVISKDTPRLYFQFPNVKRASWVVDGSGNLIWQDQGGQNHFYIQPNGQLWSQQMGDVAGYINQIAANNANYVLSVARGEYGQKVAKGGDVMSGNLTIANAQPYLDLLNNGVYRWRMQVDGSAALVWRNGDSGDPLMYLQPDGQLWLKGFGTTVGVQIENRARDFADDRLNTATARINNKTARLVYVGDMTVSSQPAGQIWEGYGSSVITGFMPDGAYPRAFRFRQLQMSDSNGNWYAIPYA